LILNGVKAPEPEETPIVEEPVVVEEKVALKKTTKKAEPVQPDVE